VPGFALNAGEEPMGSAPGSPRRPWLAEGISRSTWYRRKAKARQEAALAARAAVLDRLEWQVAELRAHLDRAAAFNAAMAAELSRAE
jgi:hypothetical protein